MQYIIEGNGEEQAKGKISFNLRRQPTLTSPMDGAHPAEVHSVEHSIRNTTPRRRPHTYYPEAGSASGRGT